MNTLAFALASLTMAVVASPASPDAAPATIVQRQSLEVNDEIGFAMVPYFQCLNDQTLQLKDPAWLPNEEHHQADQIKKSCMDAKDEAIFLSATVFERSKSLPVDERRSLIFRAIADIESMLLVAPDIPQDLGKHD